MRAAGQRGKVVPESQRAVQPDLSRAAYQRLLISARTRLASLHTLTCSPEELVGEAWLKLQRAGVTTGARGECGQYQATASLAMKQLLIDRQRARLAEKRGAGSLHHPLDDRRCADTQAVTPCLDLHRAMRRLRSTHPGAARVFQLRAVEGLTMREVSARLQRPLRSTERDWALARRTLVDYLGANR